MGHDDPWLYWRRLRGVSAEKRRATRGLIPQPPISATGRPPSGGLFVWTEMDIDDLKAAIESGRSIEEAAEFLCRADSVDDVARKCEELGLKPKEGQAR
jgi:hypothetical protein